MGTPLNRRQIGEVVWGGYRPAAAVVSPEFAALLSRPGLQSTNIAGELLTPDIFSIYVASLMVHEDADAPAYEARWRLAGLRIKTDWERMSHPPQSAVGKFQHAGTWHATTRFAIGALLIRLAADGDVRTYRTLVRKTVRAAWRSMLDYSKHQAIVNGWPPQPRAPMPRAWRDEAEELYLAIFNGASLEGGSTLAQFVHYVFEHPRSAA